MAETKEVDTTVRCVWARLATHAAKRAALHADHGEFLDAETAMAYVEAWLGNAGARATRWNFRSPDR